MNPTTWKTIAESVGIIAIVGSLVFVGLEVRQQQQAALNDSSFNLVENSREVRSLFIEHADIWVRGNAGEELDPIEDSVFETLYVPTPIFVHHLILRNVTARTIFIDSFTSSSSSSSSKELATVEISNCKFQTRVSLFRI